MIQATRRTAALLVVLAFVAVGCSRGGSSGPTATRLASRGNNAGRYGVVHTASTGIKKLAPGTWKCTATVDKKKKIGTTECTGKSDDGKSIALHAVSTFDELKKRRQAALPGVVTIKVDGVLKATLTCVGSKC